MAEASQSRLPGAFPITGMAPEPLRNDLRKRLEAAKREYIEALLGKGESWLTKVLNNQAGVMLDDIPTLLDAIALKTVGKEKVCFDPQTARAYEHLLGVAMANRSLLFEDAE